MIVFGIVYENYDFEAGKGIHDIMYTTIEKATLAASEYAADVAEELNLEDELAGGEFSPYRVEERVIGDCQPLFVVIDNKGRECEDCCVCEFTVQ